ncbi:MAG TPA: type II secretion system minor pseudopilin GspK [Janthinobacterium sp.]|jgi:general secretion pathway protein K|nr:type II secretion system minor pseudopilin GspK [Janthinobacterium sp.]
MSGRRGRIMPRRRQRGVAIITALLLTALAITIVTSLFWQQQVQVRSMENQRLHLQTKWILRGALDWARLILRQDGISTGPGSPVTLDGIWATPLAETRLDDYVERERVDGDNYNATLSGQISDAQARYNLANLSIGKNINKDQVAMFGRLLTNLQLDPGLAQATAQAIANTQQAQELPPDGTSVPGGTTTTGTTTTGTTTTATTGTTASAGTTAPASGSDGSQPMQFTQVDDLLSVPGFTSQSVEQLRDYVTVLPVQTTATALNLNTASPQVLAALVPGFSLAEATAIAARRKQTSYRLVSDFTTQLGVDRPVSAGVQIGVTSTYFLVTSHILLDRAELDAQALIQRQTDSQMTTTLLSIREN